MTRRAVGKRCATTQEPKRRLRCHYGLMILTCAVLGLALNLCGEPQMGDSRQAFAQVSRALLLQFEKYDLVALGESHNTQEDQDLRINLVRNPRFPKTVHNIVVECANALHQEVLDRFIAGATVPKEEIQRLWRDTTQSPVGGGDSPACERFLTEIRSINRNLPNGLKLRALAGDPPIDWAKINSAEEFQGFLRTRDQFAAELVLREILGRKQKALLIYGAGHLWRNVALNPAPNLASLIDRSKPGSLFTVIRLGGSYPNTPLLESVMPKSRPAFAVLKGPPAADLDANEFLGRGVPVRLFAAGLGIGQVADGCVYTGQRSDTPIASNPPDPAYEKEKERRRGFMPRPQR